MSATTEKYHDLVQGETDEEAEEAETEETPAVPEPEPEPEPEPDSSPVGEKALQAMERENSRHVNAVGKIMGADFAVVFPCPECSAGPLGFVFGEPGAAPDYRDDPLSEPCAACGGWGETLSGSKSETHRLKACPTCSGLGYMPKAGPATAQSGYGVTPTPQQDGRETVLPYLDVHGNQCAVQPDAAGRRFGDSQYGMPGAQQGGAA